MPQCSWSHKMKLFAVSLLAGLQIACFQHCTAAFAQVPFQLVCPERGFRENEVNSVECTVRGSDVKGATCAFPVSSIRLETVVANALNVIAHSPFPTCDNNWSSLNNDNGRCSNIDTNTDVYTYQFNVTADPAILTNLTGLRCFAECSGGPGVGNPFTYNTSRSCGPPVIFAAPNTETDPQAGDSSSGGLSTGAAVGVALALVFVVVGVVVVLMWRRHWVLPCASSSANGSNNTEYNESAVSPPVSVEREEQQNDRSNEMPDNKQQATSQYEILRPLDVGMRSDYAELSHCHAGMKSDDGAGKVYVGVSLL
ncbi:uncharacterized protein [Littorina saxatilis]|uniref:uncharacterized protein n=1 Tax=Littorina saxatilis TaxID=31220 RepID=UPI0038B55FAD